MFFSTTKLLKINEMHNFLSIILINYLGDFQFRQQVINKLMKNRIFASVSALLLTLGINAQTLFPQNGSMDVCADTHLVLTFEEDAKLSGKGMVRVFDVKSGECIDSLDLSIPAGPTKPRTYGPECDYTKVPYDYSRTTMPTNKTVKPGTPSGGAEPTPPE